MAVKISREDAEDFRVTVVEPVMPHEPNIYDLAYLHVELKWIREYNLNELELLIFSFINSYKPSTGKIYFSNAQLGRMFNKSEKTITRTISSLKEKSLIEVETQTGMYGGTIRYLIPVRQDNSDYSKMSRGVDKNEYAPTQKCLPNSNINNNSKYISKIDIGITTRRDKPQPISKDRTYGNRDVQSLKAFLVRNYPKPLDGVGDTRKLWNLYQVMHPRKGADEWMGLEWRKNIELFLRAYLDDTEDRFLVGSVDKLKEKAKLWREYRGKLS